MPTNDNVQLTRTHAHTHPPSTMYLWSLWHLSGVIEYLLILWPANSIWHILKVVLCSSICQNSYHCEPKLSFYNIFFPHFM